jgi:hypothetical protein
MAGIKLPKKMHATKPIMVTENQHKTIHQLVAKKSGIDARVTVVVDKMLELYVTASNELLYILNESGEYEIVEV